MHPEAPPMDSTKYTSKSTPRQAAASNSDYHSARSTRISRSVRINSSRLDTPPQEVSNSWDSSLYLEEASAPARLETHYQQQPFVAAAGPAQQAEHQPAYQQQRAAYTASHYNSTQRFGNSTEAKSTPHTQYVSNQQWQQHHRGSCRPQDPTTLTGASLITTVPQGDKELVQEEQFEKDTEHGSLYGNSSRASAGDLAAIKQAVIDSKSAFAYSNSELPGYHGCEGDMVILRKGSHPLVQSPRRMSPLQQTVQDEKCQELLDCDVIEPGNRYAETISNCVLPPKKDSEGNWTQFRMCYDYRNVNSDTEFDRYKMPVPEDIFQQIADSETFSRLDMRAGYHQINISPASCDYTSFWWNGKIYRWKRMPFGLKNAGAVFQRIMDTELARGGCSNFAKAYVDDVIIYSKNAAKHADHIKQVLKCLQEVGLRVHPDKSVFGASALEFLGFMVSKYGLTPSQAKVAAIRQLPIPRTVTELRSVLGFMNYYRVFMPNFSATANPLNHLLRKDVTYKWDDQHTAAYEQLKESLCTEGLALRRPDYSRPFILHTDWSNVGISAVLGQKDDCRQ
eukprot:jgi/Chrzof1/14338/UNPLg00612.t1